jgi:hypothetical protein
VGWTWSSEGTRYVYKVLVKKPRMQVLGRPRRRREQRMIPRWVVGK